MEANTNSVHNVLRLSHVKKMLKISGSTIYNKLNPSCKYFDETFPKPIRISVGSVGWLEHEVQHWLASLVSVSRSVKIDSNLDHLNHKKSR